jgi:hypothetical protein
MALADVMNANEPIKSRAMKKIRNGFIFDHVGWLKRMAFLARPIKGVARHRTEYEEKRVRVDFKSAL